MISLGKVTIDPPVLLAPMAGITDRPFRELVTGFGAGLVTSEMVASQEMVAAKPSMQARAEVAADDTRTSVQIAGREARWMAECAAILAGNGAQVIDINMGCPARKVTSGASGAALMRDLDHATRLIEAVVNAVDVPVTLKMRLGWNEDELNADDLARRAEAAGVRMLTVHGRTRCQFYKGTADWAAIRHIVKAVSIPVVANGDIIDGAAARKALDQSGAQAVMVGRGAIGKPWLLAEIAAFLSGNVVDLRPRGTAFADLVRRHYEAHLSFYGTETGMRAMRKHLDAYLAQIPGAQVLRPDLIRETDPAQLFARLGDLGTIDAGIERLAA